MERPTWTRYKKAKQMSKKTVKKDNYILLDDQDFEGFFESEEEAINYVNREGESEFYGEVRLYKVIEKKVLVWKPYFIKVEDE